MRVEDLKQVLVEYSPHSHHKGLYVILESQIEHVVRKVCNVRHPVIIVHLNIFAIINKVDSLRLAKNILIMTHSKAQVFNWSLVIIFDIEQVQVHLLINSLEVIYLIAFVDHLIEEEL